MTEENSEERELRHKLDNSRQEKAALQGLLARAAKEIEDLAEADCEDVAKDRALAKAEKFRKAASL